MDLPCVSCKRIPSQSGHAPSCPLAISFASFSQRDFSGVSSNICIGSYGYPRVRVGLLSSHQPALDHPKELALRSLPEIIFARSSLINSFHVVPVEKQDSFLSLAQLVAQAKKPSEVELSLEKVPIFRLQHPPGSPPHGASVGLKKASLLGNVKVSSFVEKVLSDELSASEQLKKLSVRLDEHAQTKLLTAGLLGSDKRLVPTRWGITAVDDMRSLDILASVKQFPCYNVYSVFFFSHFGNSFLIACFPHQWQFSLREYALDSRKHVPPTVDYESWNGRSTYAKNTSGAYYAARVAVVEWLRSQRRQASVLVLRFISDAYTAPLGVWVIREGVRTAFSSSPLSFSSQELLLRYISLRMKQFGVVEDLSSSPLIRGLSQRTLF